jgi:hypothetical protein
MKPAIERLRTQEEKDQFAASMLNGALKLESDQISDELRNEMTKTAFELFGPAKPIPQPKGPYPSSKPPHTQE